LKQEAFEPRLMATALVHASATVAAMATCGIGEFRRILPAMLLVAADLLLPFMPAGYYLGNRMHHALSRAGMLKLVAGRLAANEALWVVRGLSSLGLDRASPGLGAGGPRRCRRAADQGSRAREIMDFGVQRLTQLRNIVLDSGPSKKYDGS
jgi:hypothetical protein